MSSCEEWERNQGGGSSTMDRWNEGRIEPYLPKPPARILDVGSGPSRSPLVDRLCGMGYDAYGLDVRAPENEPRHIRASMERPPAFAEKFDVVLCFETLEHILHDYEALVAIRGWLNETGTLLMSVPDMTGGENYPFHVRNYQAWSLAILLKHAGFAEVETRKFGTGVFAVARVQKR